MYNDGDLDSPVVIDCVKLLVNQNNFILAMEQVTLKWPYSCQHFLTNPEINRRAWIGAAVCSYMLKATENQTRQAWSLMTDFQRYIANKCADNFICTYMNNSNNNQLSLW